MSAMEKALRLQLVAAVCSVVVVLALLPFMGDRARGGFALLAIGGLAGFFLRKKSDSVVVDERDAKIDRLARDRSLAIGGGFMLLVLVFLISTGDEQGTISKTLLSWFMWWAFAITMAVRGLTGMIEYRRDRQSAA